MMSKAAMDMIIWNTIVMFTGKLVLKRGKKMMICCVFIIDHICCRETPIKKLTKMLLVTANVAAYSTTAADLMS